MKFFKHSVKSEVPLDEQNLLVYQDNVDEMDLKTPHFSTSLCQWTEK